MKNIKKICSIILITIFVFTIFPLQIFASSDVVYIYNMEDYEKLSKASKSDTYTKGKTYILNTDLDFTNKEFTTISQFNGIFKGNGHLIFGIKNNTTKSNYGFIRTIGVDGVVSNLNIEIELESLDIGENIGGVCGINYGKIENVNVVAQIKGIKNVGGVVGTNHGIINSVNVKGKILGEHTIGGVAGFNDGNIEQCISNCNVNNEYINVTTYEISIISYLPTQLAKLLLPDEITGVTDVGGICGYSSGNIYKCTNQGCVGYIKNGSNIGGIVGRATGTVISCTNMASIYGKNDVAGIVGQLMPKTHWELAENKLNKISNDLSVLHENVNSLLDKFDGFSGNFNSNIKAFTAQLDIVEKNLNTFLDNGETWVDSSVEKVNDLSDKLSIAISILNGSSANLEKSMNELSTSFGYFSKSSDDIKKGIDYYSGNTDSLLTLIDNIKTTTTYLSSLTGKYAQIYKNGEAVFEDINDIGSCFKTITSLLESYYTLLKYLYDMSNSLREFVDNNSTLIGISTAITIASVTVKLKDVLNELEDIMNLGVDSGKLYLSTILDINDTISSVIPLLESLSNEIIVINEGTEYFKDFFEDFSSASSYLSTGLSYFGSSLGYITSALSYLSDGTLLKFDYLSSYISDSQKAFFDSLEELNNKINDLSNGVDDKELSEEVKKTSDAFFNLVDDIISSLNDLSSIQKRKLIEEDNITYSQYQDITLDKEQYSIVYNCVNNGKIESENNAGGIVGLISIDVENLEESLNLEGLLISGSKYIISSTVEKSNNYSSVFAKKGYAGGIVGKQLFGLIIDSYSESYVTSESDYVGGIVGYSETSVVSSKSRSSVKGVSYLGGIAGKIKNVENNISVCDIISGSEYTGAICGYCDGTIINNKYGVYFNGGIDGFDYKEKAYFDDSDDFVKENDISENVKVTFITDSSVVEKTYKYNTKITDMPVVDNKDGKYWTWIDLPKDNIRCNMTINGEFVNPKTTISTGEDVPSVLVEGVFFNNNVLKVQTLDENDKSFTKKIIVSDYDKKLIVRMKSTDKGQLYMLSSDELVNIPYTVDGSYKVFEIDNGSVVRFEINKPNILLIVILSIVAFVILAAIVVIIILLIKRRRDETKKLTTIKE